MATRQKLKGKLYHEENGEEEEKLKSAAAMSSDDEEGNEDLSLKIVEKHMLMRAAKLDQDDSDSDVVLNDNTNTNTSDNSNNKNGGVEAVVPGPSGTTDDVIIEDVKSSDKKRIRLRKKKKKEADKIEIEDQSVIVRKEEQKVETADNGDEGVTTVEISDNIVLRKLLRGPRYFDPPDRGWQTCYNCGEEGHMAVNCRSAVKRKKPCFVCGSLEHGVRQCSNFDTNCYFNVLPEECVATVFSLTGPLDACRSSSVSSSFRSAMDSDIIWDKFLPSDWLEIVSKSVSPLAFSSKKELFALLCHPFLIDAGKISFKLEKSSGKKSYILSARALSITWSSNPIYWSWVSMQESRFSEVAVLRTSNWLEIEGKIKTKMLSQNTMYGAYLIIKISDRAYGLDSEAAEISIEIGGRRASKGKAYLGSKQKSNSSVLENGMEMMVTSKLIDKGGENEQIPREKEDGWVEIELGKFFNGVCDDDEVKMSLKEVKGYQLKGGIIVEGMEVRPKH